VECDVNLIKNNIRQINPDSVIFETSAKKNLGIEELANFIINYHSKKYHETQ